ncbi:DHA2 family efflux MFS transporter permease subunit [Actinokineospora globicatena]|uniref:DHA2 family efflux MFS transporter permease subunit n=1 Tax=Actinokineospora globicatena TaxID=103729 RepID=UPI0020A35AE0|nr:DHA2 family efflux MFS transporter permease subunit [Actinokineospora globicatena]MCP2303719.1 drug resistance transporter, EmrB/QacA subfamily [Actinokineospora globicatena]GLW79133.1 MFS transporter [Actinokineospora globicatena]GLW86457.1 MFS transporter [Actinokineospora globicatena]
MSTGAARPAVDLALWRTAFVLVLGTFMATIDTTIVSVAMDVLVDRFAVAVTDIHWVSTAYLLAVVAAVPASGWLADRFGGRRAWTASIAVFLLASLLCALAWSLPSLIAFRVLQGVAGGLLPPLGQALLARAAGPDRIGRVISVVAVVPLLSPVLGPLAGGAILGATSWPWLFCVNIPVGAVALLLGHRCVPAGARAERGTPFDLRGAALLSPGLAVLVYGLTGLGHTASAPLSVAAIALGAAMLVAFVVHGLRTRGVPLIDPRLFTRPPFGAAAMALVTLGASVFGTMFLLPLYLQRAAGQTAWETGLLLAPQGIGAAAGSLWVSGVVHRLAPRTLVLSGIVLVALGTVVFTQLARDVPDALIAGSLLVRGLGAAMIGAPVMTLAYRAVAPSGLPRAAGALSLLNTLGGSVGTAVIAVVLHARFTVRGPDAAAAFADTFWLVLALAVLAAVAATRLPRPRQRDQAGPPPA